MTLTVYGQVISHHRDRDDANAQDFGWKSQDRAGPLVLEWQMKTRDIATELDRAFAAATRHALMNGVVINDTIDPLYASHKALNAKHACRELTDEQYTEKARELLWMIGWLRSALFHKTMA